MGALKVLLEKVTDLRDTDGIGKSDPYVKFELVQDNMVFDHGYGRKESSKKNNDLSPVYNETFEFNDIPSLNNMVLKICIMDSDIGLDKTLGECEIKLERQHLDANPKSFDEILERKFTGFKTNAIIHLKLSFV
jgi:Ca2+-dependent lipid-binding protein